MVRVRLELRLEHKVRALGLGIYSFMLLGLKLGLE